MCVVVVFFLLYALFFITKESVRGKSTTQYESWISYTHNTYTHSLSHSLCSTLHSYNVFSFNNTKLYFIDPFWKSVYESTKWNEESHSPASWIRLNIVDGWLKFVCSLICFLVFVPFQCVCACVYVCMPKASVCICMRCMSMCIFIE